MSERPINSQLYEEIRKKYARFCVSKTPIFILGPLLQNQLHLIFYTFLLIKKYVPSIFFIFSFFFLFDLFGRNLSLVLTKRHLSTAHLP